MAIGITNLGPENAAQPKAEIGWQREANGWLRAPHYMSVPFRVNSQADLDRKRDNADFNKLGFTRFFFKKIGNRIRRIF